MVPRSAQYHPTRQRSGLRSTVHHLHVVLAVCLILMATLSAVTVVHADDLAAVKRNRILYFGVATSFSPFAFNGAGDTLHGIDLELMNRIGIEIGVHVENVDIAFAGLVDALLAGQVDVIGGALPIYPQLADLIDYSNTYYQGTFGLLTLKGTFDTLAFSPAELTWLRIGVQRGTVQAQFVRSYWIGGGLIHPSQVIYFDDRDAAIEALNWSEIDCFLTSEQIYRRRYEISDQYNWLTDESLHLRFGFATRKGSSLIPEINRILGILGRDGTAQRIAERQLQDARFITLPPDFTRSIAIPDILASRDCTMAARFLGDESIPDGTVLLPETNAVKTWRVANIGTCDWLEGTVLVPLTAPESFTPVMIGTVKSGETVSISLPFVTPRTTGAFVAAFRLAAPDGTFFGQSFQLRIEVQENH